MLISLTRLEVNCNDVDGEEELFEMNPGRIRAKNSKLRPHQ